MRKHLGLPSSRRCFIPKPPEPDYRENNRPQESVDCQCNRTLREEGVFRKNRAPILERIRLQAWHGQEVIAKGFCEVDLGASQHIVPAFSSRTLPIDRSRCRG